MRNGVYRRRGRKIDWFLRFDAFFASLEKQKNACGSAINAIIYHAKRHLNSTRVLPQSSLEIDEKNFQRHLAAWFAVAAFYSWSSCKLFWEELNSKVSIWVGEFSTGSQMKCYSLGDLEMRRRGSIGIAFGCFWSHQQLNSLGVL